MLERRRTTGEARAGFRIAARKLWLWASSVIMTPASCFASRISRLAFAARSAAAGGAVPRWNVAVRAVLAAVAMAVVVRPVFADRVAELARIHLEAIGGQQRVDALKAMRATGQVIAGGKRVKFTMIAARPNRARVETESGGRTLIQATDGREAPWEFDTGEWPPRYRDMRATVAKVFLADAEFDDPLVVGRVRGFSIDYAGEVEAGAGKLIRLLVTRNLTTSFSLLLDPDTLFIVERVEERKSAVGRTIQVVTRFSDYRPVDGVLVAHEIVQMVDGQVSQHTKIENIQPNPEVSEETFTRPRSIRVPR